MARIVTAQQYARAPGTESERLNSSPADADSRHAPTVGFESQGDSDQHTRGDREDMGALPCSTQLYLSGNTADQHQSQT